MIRKVARRTLPGRPRDSHIAWRLAPWRIAMGTITAAERKATERTNRQVVPTDGAVPDCGAGQPTAGSQRLQEGVHFLFRFLACKRWVIAQQLVDHLLAEQLVDHFLAHLLRRFRQRLGLVFRWIRIADPGRPLPE